jgi:hypothetical protein
MHSPVGVVEELFVYEYHAFIVAFRSFRRSDLWRWRKMVEHEDYTPPIELLLCFLVEYRASL